jgi:GH24 family phage-related lysozyme (muramidase)
MNDPDTFASRRRELIKHGEGSISHMYLDTVGKVTVGVGNMLPDADAAAQLPFYFRDTGTPASETEIREEFDRIEQEEPARLASWYKQHTRLDLSDEAIDQLLDGRIDDFEAGLLRDFNDYDAFPEAAKIGLMDMAFNLGNSGLVNKFPSFTRAARAMDWETCAAECRRRDVSDARNEEARGLFESIV